MVDPIDEVRYLVALRLRGLHRPSVGAVVRWSSPVAALTLAGLMAATTGLPFGAVVPPLFLLVFVACGAAAVRAAALAGRRQAWRMRRVWWCIAYVAAANFGVGAVYGYALTHPGRVADALLPFGYALRGSICVAELVAVLQAPAPRRTRRELGALGMDLAMVAGSAVLGCWYFIVGPAVADGRPGPAVLLAVGVVAADVVVLSGATFALLRGVAAEGRPAVRGLLAAVTFFAAPDFLLGDSVARGGRFADSQLPMALVLVGAVLILVTAVQGCRPGSVTPQGPATPSTEPAVGSLTPYVCVLLGYGLLVAAAVRSPLYPWGGLAIGTILMTGGAVARQLVTLDQNRRAAGTDHVTGVANRSGLVRALERALGRAERSGVPAAVLMFDLDGFKGINDTFGHEAGDEALVAFARVLRTSVLGSDTVGRLGGDEFVVVLNAVRRPEDAVLVAERILEDLRTPRRIGGAELTLRTSIGITLTRGGEDTPATALARADRAMYDAKRESGSRWRVEPERASLPA